MTNKSFAILMLSLCLMGCEQKTRHVDGVKIGGVDGALFYNATDGENQKLVDLIKRTLANDKSAMKDLLNFDCGGGAGCYDLGFIITEIIYKMGEDEFITLIANLSEQDKSMLKSLIMAGLEYGYPPPDSQEPNQSRTIEKEFPALARLLINN